MTIVYHPSAQETASGNSSANIEPGLKLKSLVVSVSQISVNVLGGIVLKLQHSADGTDWFDVPNFATGSLTGTGNVTVAITDDAFVVADFTRLVWTFTNANSITFVAFATGTK